MSNNTNLSKLTIYQIDNMPEVYQPMSVEEQMAAKGGILPVIIKIGWKAWVGTKKVKKTKKVSAMINSNNQVVQQGANNTTTFINIDVWAQRIIAGGVGGGALVAGAAIAYDILTSDSGSYDGDTEGSYDGDDYDCYP